MQLTDVVIDDAMMERNRPGAGNSRIDYYYEDIYKYRDHEIGWHWHREFEFMLIERGKAQIRIGEEEYILQEGEAVFINSGVMHSFRACASCIAPNIVFPAEFIAQESGVVYQKYVLPFLENPYSCMLIRGEREYERELSGQLREIFRICRDRADAWEILVQSGLCRLWGILFLNRGDMVCTARGTANMLTETRLKKMTVFIREHFMDRISLGDIAEAGNIGKNEAIRCFRAGRGMTPIEYLRKYRLSQAEKLLLETDSSFTEIASLTGFDDPGYFSRLFKKEFGESPRAMKKRVKNFK